MIPFIVTVMAVLFYVYILGNVSKKKFKLQSFSFWISILITASVLSISHEFIVNYLLLITDFIFFILLTKYLLEKRWSYVLISGFICYILFAIFAMVIAITITSSLETNMEELIDVSIYNVIYLLVIFVAVLFVFRIHAVNNFFFKIIESTDQQSVKVIILWTGLILVITCWIVFSTFYQGNVIFTSILSILVIVSFFTLTMVLVNDKNKIVKKEIENNVLIRNLKEYEKMLEINLIQNHESKNSLIVIKGFLDGKDDKKLKEYVETLINDRYEDDESLLYKTSKLPSGGLQGLVYQKMLNMKKENINVLLEIGKGINTSLFDKIDSKTHYDICTIIGVYLDNAIDAVKNLSDKNIILSFYKSGTKIHASISNNYFGEIDLERIYKSGYSTKGKNRGFGLEIVRKTVENNSKLSLSHEIIGNVFKQILKAKIDI